MSEPNCGHQALGACPWCYERTLGRADRSEAEFCACKALLMAAQKRAERAEAERAEAELQAREAGELWAGMTKARDAAEQRASEARAALEQLFKLVDDGILVRDVSRDHQPGWTVNAVRLTMVLKRAHDALAALPVEPARRQVTEIANALDTPAERSPATPEEGT